MQTVERNGAGQAIFAGEGAGHVIGHRDKIPGADETLPARAFQPTVAVDQLGMGYSEDPAGTLSQPRTLAQRIETPELPRVLPEAPPSPGPVVTESTPAPR